MNRLAAASLSFFVVAAAVVALGGCTRPATSPTKTAAAKPAAAGSDNLTQAFNTLRQRAEGLTANSDETNGRLIFYLNQWLAGAVEVEQPWQPDPMIDSLSRSMKTARGLNALGTLTFAADDLDYLQQNLWLSDVVQLQRKQPPAADLAPWLAEIENSVGLPESEQLALAERLFDWTTRNIQLDPLPPAAKGPVATVGAATDAGLPAAQGEPGPGYRLLPHEVLLRGHGDAWERSRVFLLLCRQAGLDGAMLGLIDESVSNLPQPWLAAVLVGQQLYLFDASLGLPLPGPDGQGIATLAEIVAEPKLLRQLDLERGAAYPIADKHLKQIVALIDAEPAAVCRRMALLEQALGSRKIDLAVEPSQVKAKLSACKELAGISLWRVPLEAATFAGWRAEQLKKLKDDSQKWSLFRLAAPPDEILMCEGNPITWGRNLQLQGRLENRETERLVGARALFMESRMTEQQIEALATSENARRAMSFASSLPKDEKFRAQVMQRYLDMFRRTKQHATYFLALTYFDDGKYEAAAEWLRDRTLDSPYPTPWEAGARYNLARCYEALGRWEDARRILAADEDSPQKHGNHLRAQWLAQRHPSAP
ncbi:MAG: CDC27 family protein [Pirellulaceae bacterium]|nr:CDC27 family protein [Pirellulaceae bacterium]